MLKESIDAYLSLRRAVGYQLKTEGHQLADFWRWANKQGETHVRAQAATAWAALGRSPWQRERRLRTVAAFARHARAEDARHEVPPTGVFAHRHVRPVPHIYAPDEVCLLLEAASQLAPTWPLRSQVFTTLFGLLAATGMRVSEALALRLDDVTADGLVIRKTKFNKTRLVPLHPTTVVALDRFLDLRRSHPAASEYIFISPKGGRLSQSLVSKYFLRLARQVGLRGAPGRPGPRLHDLRHTFAVRALEACPGRGTPVAEQVRALSTYLGHTHVADTCWYLHTTPQLMRSVSDACEHLLEGDAP